MADHPHPVRGFIIGVVAKEREERNKGNDEQDKPFRFGVSRCCFFFSHIDIELSQFPQLDNTKQRALRFLFGAAELPIEQ